MGGTRERDSTVSRGQLARDVILVDLQRKGLNVSTSSKMFEKLTRTKLIELRKMKREVLMRLRAIVEDEMKKIEHGFFHHT